VGAIVGATLGAAVGVELAIVVDRGSALEVGVVVTVDEVVRGAQPSPRHEANERTTERVMARWYRGCDYRSSNMRFAGFAIAAVVCACGARTGLPVPDAIDASSDVADTTDTSEPVDTTDTAETTIDTRPDIFEEAPDFARLDGLRWELPCLDEVTSDVCTTERRVQKEVTLTGPKGARYRVTLRFRGVIEEKSYTGGTNDGAYWQVGGMWVSDDWNIYSLDLSSPLQRYYLNRGVSGRYVCVPIDYVKDVEIDTGSTVLLDAISVDAQEIRNLDSSGKPIVVPDVKPAPKAFDGQFIQMDVLAIVRVK